MLNSEDWLQDPLRIVEGGSPKWRKLKSSDERRNELWEWDSFHFATRLKLDGAKFFCTKVIDIARTPEDELEWYLDGFFFELMAACDTLLQELNTVYAYDLQLKPEAVRWNKIKDKLPDELVKYVEEERRKDWFCEVQWYRNTTTHHYHIPKTSLRRHDPPYSADYVGLGYIDKEGRSKIREIIICKDYLSNMVNYISSVWQIMAEKFE